MYRYDLDRTARGGGRGAMPLTFWYLPVKKVKYLFRLFITLYWKKQFQITFFWIDLIIIVASKPIFRKLTVMFVLNLPGGGGGRGQSTFTTGCAELGKMYRKKQWWKIINCGIIVCRIKTMRHFQTAVMRYFFWVPTKRSYCRKHVVYCITFTSAAAQFLSILPYSQHRE